MRSSLFYDMPTDLRTFDRTILTQIPALAAEFLQYQLTVRGRSPKTVWEYGVDMRTFFRYYRKEQLRNVPDSMDFEDIDASKVTNVQVLAVDFQSVLDYMNYLVIERHNSANTRLRKTSSLRRFYQFLTDQKGLLPKNPLESLESPKRAKTLPKYLTLEQSIDLLQAVDGPDAERDICILTLFLNCGMRLSELVGINLSDIRHHDATLRLLGKGNKERVIYLNPACLEAIDRYIAVRPKDGVQDRNALFLSRLKKRISPKTVQYIVKKYLGKIEMSGYSVHKLRHTAATLMYQHGDVDIRVLKDVLGHENLGTTEIYTHLSSAQMQQAANSNPLAKVKPKSKSKNVLVHDDTEK